MAISEINRILARHDGVISAQQAIGAGLSRDAIERRIIRGEWRRITPGIYFSTERPWDKPAQLRAAVAGAGSRATADGTSAAWWHGLLSTPPIQWSVTVPADRYLKRSSDIRIRRRDLDWTDVDTVRSLRVTTLPLTVLEAAVVVRGGAQLMDRALQRRVSLPILQAMHEKHLGRRGSKAAAAMLRIAAEGGASEAERIHLRLLRGAGLTGWRTHVRICGFEVDVAFESQRLIIEVDGWAWHRDVERFDGDAKRQNALINAGWHVLRFTYHRLVGDPAGVINDIRIALRTHPQDVPR